MCVEVIGAPRCIPEPEFPANPRGVTCDEVRYRPLVTHPRVVPHIVDGKGHEKELSLPGIGGDERAPKQRDLEHVLAEVVAKLGVKRVDVGQENVGKRSRRRRRG